MTAAWRPLRTGSRYCPDCLEEKGDRWPLAWRLPWTFACQQHGCLLIDFCPGCHGRPRITASRASEIRRPGRCTRLINTGRDLRTCGQPLALAAAAALPRDGVILGAQRHVAALLEQLPKIEHASFGSPLHDLYVLGWRSLRALHLGGPAPDAVRAVLDECGHDPDRFSLKAVPTTDQLAIGSTLGMLSTNSHSQTAAELLTWIVRADHGSPGRRLQQWRSVSSRLVARVLGDADSDLPIQRRLRYRSATRQPTEPDLGESSVRQRAKSVPSLLWHGWSIRLLPTAALDPRTRDDYRRTCAAMLLLPGAQVGFLQAARMLGLDPRLPSRAAFPKVVTQPDHATIIASCLGQLATQLDLNGCPIDYARRRALFTSDTISLDLDAYVRLCRREGWSRGGNGRVQRLRWALLSLLLGAHADLPDGMVLHDRDEFRLKMPPLLRSFLIDQATDNLTHHKIHEPVLWEPPGDWCQELAWPGSSPDAVSNAGFAAMAAAGTQVEDIAYALHLTAEHLRLYCDATGNTAPPPGPAVPGLGRRTPRRGLLDPEYLRAAHTSGTLNQSLIARRAGCSPATVQNALEEAGIPASPRPQPLSHQITRAELEHAYLHQRRSIPDIAEQFGLDRHRLNLLAKKWGIP
ncbi:TniQ protein, partial [Streptomyces sp. DvalAA-14]|uniref:TniQ family protein n=1 Tax=unclassified Streptomyces TaxID=2593676 RepID=UPI00081B0ABF